MQLTPSISYFQEILLNDALINLTNFDKLGLLGPATVRIEKQENS